jgi:LacI family transcriptional regulator
VPRSSKPVQRRVAVCVDKSRAYGRGVLRGIADYVEAHGRWSLYLDPRASGRYDAEWLRDWKGDGVLGFIEDPELAAAFRRARIPAVELFGHRLDLDLPHVGNDEEAVGELAARHFVERQFRQFGFVGVQDALWSTRRCSGFASALSPAPPATFLCSDHERSSLAAWESTQARLRAWLRELPKPVGVMAASDRLALRVLDACRAESLAVPEQVAVIGVDNDEETCRLADPPLSSVMDDAVQVGRLAAELLDDFMSGRQRPGQQQVLVPPLGIVTRRSTEFTAIDDPLIARACQMIREQACEGLVVADITRALRISKTLFYARFKKALNRLPHQEIARVRLARAQSLLRQTAWPVAEVAARCGFTHPEYLIVAFKRELGTTPGKFRRNR